MKLYNHRTDVVTAKQWLKQLGFYTGSDMSDYFTPQLVKAVKKFQQSVKIGQSGAINKKTWQKLKETI